MTTIKKGDFVELNYVAKLKEDGSIFDTTKEEVAKKEGIPLQKEFGPITACVGEGHVLKGIDKALEGKETGKNYTIDVIPEEGFGKKNPKLLQLIPRKVFKEQNIQPMVGLEINVDNQVGVIRSASGGRVIVDFNHPFASKDLTYDLEILRIVTEKKEKVEAVLNALRMPVEKVEMKGETAEVITQAQMPDQFVEIFAKDIVRTTGVKDIKFVTADNKTKKSSSDKETTKENSETKNSEQKAEKGKTETVEPSEKKEEQQKLA